MMALSAAPPARRMVSVRWRGSGLRKAKVSCPVIAAKRGARPSRPRSLRAGASNLLVQTAKQPALGGEAVEHRLRRRDRAGSRRRGDRRRAPCSPGAGVQRRRRERAAFGGERRLEHDARAAADHRDGGLDADRHHAFGDEDGVQRRHQVVRGVDERAVEVEDDRRCGHDGRSEAVAARHHRRENQDENEGYALVVHEPLGAEGRPACRAESRIWPTARRQRMMRTVGWIERRPTTTNAAIFAQKTGFCS